mgnify:CR=1 FL=1
MPVGGKGREGEEHLAEVGEPLFEFVLPGLVEVEGEVVDPEEGLEMGPCFKLLPLGEAQSSCRCLFLPLARKEFCLFPFDQEGEIVAVGTCEGEAEFALFEPVFFKEIAVLGALFGEGGFEVEGVGLLGMGEEVGLSA